MHENPKNVKKMHETPRQNMARAPTTYVQSCCGSSCLNKKEGLNTKRNDENMRGVDEGNGAVRTAGYKKPGQDS